MPLVIKGVGGVTTHALLDAIEHFKNEPQPHSKLIIEALEEEIGQRRNIWMERGHTYNQACRIMGLPAK